MTSLLAPLVGVVLVAALVSTWRVRAWWSTRSARLVRVHIIGGPSVDGVLVARHRWGIVVETPRLVDSVEAGPVALESPRVVIPWDRVVFWEVVG